MYFYIQRALFKFRGEGGSVRKVVDFIQRRECSASISSQFTPIDPLPGSTIPGYVWEGMDRWADRTAVECGLTGRRVTYSELRETSWRFGCSLVDLGLRPGEVVALALPNGPLFPAALLGPIEKGLVVSTINPLYTTEEMYSQLKNADAKCIIAHTSTLSSVMSAIRKLNKSLPVISISDSGISGNLPPSVIDFRNLVAEGRGAVGSSRESVDINSTAILPYSSGTTGLPKGVCLTHSSTTANLAQLAHPEYTRIQQASKEEQDVLPAILPFFHCFGMIVVMLQGLSKGAKLVTLPKFEPESFLKILESNKDIVLHVAPPMILFLGSYPGVKEKHLDSVRLTITGAAPCASSDIERVHQRKRIPILQAYGMTESGPVLTYPDPRAEDTSTIGVLLANTDGKVVHLETGKDLEAGEVGELCFKGPQLMKGYHNLPEATNEAIDDKGWLHTGDIGYYDKRTNFYVLDRKKELIKVKGYQVAPAELEGILRSHPDIQDAGVVGVPSQREGEKPVAFLVVKPGSSHPKESQLESFIAEKVAPYKRISNFTFVDAIPKNPSGKILRRKMKEIANRLFSDPNVSN